MVNSCATKKLGDIMLFLGCDGLCGTDTMIETPVSCDNIKDIKASNSIVNDLYITKDISSNYLDVPISNEWDWNTILHATFDGNIFAGNITFMLNQITSIVIKYREYGRTDWITLDIIPIHKAEDLTFTRYCKWCRGNNTTYEFVLIPMLDKVEGNYEISSVQSNFDDLFIMSKDNTYHMINTQITPTRTFTSSILKPLKGKYPIMIYNDGLNYDSLSIQGMFIGYLNHDYDKASTVIYRKQAIDLLTSKIPLIIKYQDGRIWLVAVTDTVSDDSTNYTHEGYTLTKFTCCEVGESDNYNDLTNNGFLTT